MSTPCDPRLPAYDTEGTWYPTKPTATVKRLSPAQGEARKRELVQEISKIAAAKMVNRTGRPLDIYVLVTRSDHEPNCENQQDVTGVGPYVTKLVVSGHGWTQARGETEIRSLKALRKAVREALLSYP